MIPIRGLRAPVVPDPQPKAEPAPPARVFHARTHVAWTPEREALLETLWHAGEPVLAIAEALGSPEAKNAVIGKANRMGLPRRQNPVGRLYGGKHG